MHVKKRDVAIAIFEINQWVIYYAALFRKSGKGSLF
jgi:hypothetical protein